MVKYLSAIDGAFQALADPTRRALVARLSRGPASVSELAEPLPMSLPAVVQHLAVLEASGIVVSEKVGRVRTCRLDSGGLSLVERWITDRRIRTEEQLDRLEAFLDQTEPIETEETP